MNEEALRDAYNLFVETGYSGTVEDFSSLIETNNDALKDAHDLFVKTGYNGSIEDFSGLVKKKEESQRSQQDSTLLVGNTDAVTGDQTRDGVSESSTPITDGMFAESEQTEAPYEYRFKPEEEAGSRYKQAGEPYLPNIVKGLRDKIKEQEGKLAEMRSNVQRTPTGMVYSSNQVGINLVEDELDKRRELLRKYSEQRDKIDSSYASDVLGEGEAAKDIQEMMDFERGLEGDVWDFFSRGFSALVRVGQPYSSFETGAVKKQRLKESLEEVIDMNIKSSAKRVIDQKTGYETTAKEIGDVYGEQVKALNEEYLGGNMSYADYEQSYKATMESASRDEAELNEEYQRYASMGDLYLNSLQNLSMTNQYDDLNPLESGVKSFANEILKTPRQAAGLIMATAPILELMGNPMVGLPRGIPTEAYLDGMSPVTDYLTALTEENLLRIDPDDTKANLTGEITGQLAKIIPAAAAAPAAGVLVSAGMSFDEMYQSTKDTEGLTDAEAVKLAAIYTPVGTVLEYFGARTAIGAVNKKVAIETAKRIIIQRGLLGIGKKEATIALQNTFFKELGINMTKEFFEEGITESLQTAAQEGIKQLKNVQRGETLFEFDGGEFFDNIVESFLIGGIAGAGAAGVFTTIGMGGSQKTGFQTYKETLLNNNIYNTLTKRIMESKLTDAQKQTAIKTMERDAEILRSVDDIGLTQSEQERAAGLIARKVALEEFVEGKDPSVTTNIREDIKAIEDALKQFEAKVETQETVIDTADSARKVGQEVGQDVQAEVKVKPDQTVEEVEAKKADIEKRRQEELGNRVVNDGETAPTAQDGEFKILGDDRLYRINEATGRPQVFENGFWSNTELAPSLFLHNAKKTGWQRSKDQINAKYDAELKALEKQEGVSLQPDETAQEVRVEADQKTKEQKAAEVESNDNKRSDEILSGKEAVTKVLDTPVTEFNNITIEEAQDAYDQAETAKQEVEKSNISRPRKKELIDLLNELQTEIKSNETKFKTKDSVKQTTKTTKVTSIRATERKAEKAKPIKTVRDAVDKEVVYNGQKGRLRIGEDKAILFEASDGTLTEVPAGSKNQSINLSTLGMKPYTAPQLTGGKVVIDGKDSGQLVSVNKDGDGNVVSYTVKRDGQDRTIRDADGALDLAIQQQQEALGKVPDVELSRFEQIFTEIIEEVVSEAGAIRTTPVISQQPSQVKPDATTAKPKTPTTAKPKITPPKSRQVGEQTKKAETKAEEVTKSEKKQKVYDSIDKIAEDLKKRLAAKGIDGIDIQTQGISQNDIIDLAAKAAKALAATGIEINAAIQKVTKELRDMGLLAKEDVVDFEASTKAKIQADQPLPTQKQTEEQLGQQEKEVSKEADEKLNSLKNKSLAEGMEEVYEAERNALRMNTQEMIDMGKEAVTSGRINPIALIEGILANPRALQVEEQAALLYYKVKLNNEINNLAERVNEARDSGNQEARSLYGIQFAEKMAQFEALEKSTLLAGVKQGQSLYFRRLMVDSMYNLASQVNIYKAITGSKTVPVEVQEKFKRYDEELKELNRKIDDYEKRLKANEGKLFVPQRAEKKGGLTPQEKARKTELRSKFFGVMNDASRIASFLVDKEFYEYSGLVLKEAKGDFTEFSRKMINSVGKGVRKHLPKLYKDLGGKGETKFEAKQPEIDQDGTLFIPDEFIIDLIDNGFDKIETIVPEIVSIMKMNGTEVSERQVRDAISDYGKRTILSKNEIDVILRRMKRAGKLISSLEDVRQKKKPLRSGRERDKKTQQERELERKINILLREIPQTNEEIEGRWRSALDGVKARMRNRIEDIKKQLETGEKTPKRNPIALDAEAQILKKELDYYVELLKAAEGPRKMTNEQRVSMIQNGLERRKSELEQRIRDKKFDPEVRAEKVTSPAIEKLRGEIEALNEKYKELEKREAPNLAVERKNEQRKKALDNKINKLKDQLTNKVVEQSKKEAEIPKNAAVLEAERQVNQLREEIKQLDEYKAMAERKRLELLKKNAQKSIDRYQQRIKDGDFETKKPVPVQLDEEGKRLKIQQQRWKNKFDLEREKAKLENRTFGQKFFDNFLDVWNVPRSLMASVDLSAPLRQGFLLSVRNPRAAARAFGQMFQQMRSEEKYEAWLDMVEQDPDYVFAKSVGLYIAKPNSVLMAKEEQFMSSLASRIPFYGTVLVRGSERAYSAYLNVLRMNVWKGFVRNMELAGLDKEADKINYKYMAKFINNATGRGDLLGAGEQTEKVLNSMFFAPRYVMSRFNVIGNTLTGYAMYPKAVRIEALKTIAAYISTGLGIMALALAAGADVEDDPRSTDFGKIRFGDLRLDIWAGFQQPVRLIATMLTRQKKSIMTGEIKDLNIDKFGSGTVYDEAHRFVRTKFSPVASLFADYLSAPQDVKQEGVFGYEESVLFKNVVGQNMTASEKLLSMVAPLYLQDMDEIYSSGGPMMAAGVLLPAMFGIGAQYYAPDKIDAANTTLEEAENFDFDDLELDEFDFDLDNIEFKDTDF